MPFIPFHWEPSSWIGLLLFKIFCGVFLANSDKEPKLNHELVSYKKMTFNEIEQNMQKTPDEFCQGFRNDFNRVKKFLN